ncbi:MAG: group III truncated hemoglobin [Thermomicrobiales bacterium]
MSETRQAEARRDIESREDLARLITVFYGRAFEDPIIGYIFTDVTHMDLDAHLPIMCDFWEKVLFQRGIYGRDAFTVHKQIDALEPLTRRHFQAWEDLWHATVDDLFAGERATLAKIHASRMAGSIQRRLANSTDGNLLQIRVGTGARPR